MKKKKKRIKFKGILIILVILLFVFLLVYLYRSLKITNIYVTGNKYLSESTILHIANLEEYPKICDVNEKMIKEELIKNPLIKEVNIKKSLFGKIYIDIEEYIPLYKDNNNQVILSNGEIIELEITRPFLLDSVSEDVYDKFLNALTKINDDIIIKISEIRYSETELDKERFLFIMNDGNYVYITLSKIELINTYNEIYPTLENNKGILYLDSGNHFEIKDEKEKIQ